MKNWLDYFTQEFQRKGISQLNATFRGDKPSKEVTELEAVTWDEPHMVYLEERSQSIGKDNVDALIWCDKALFGQKPLKIAEVAYNVGLEIKSKNTYAQLIFDVFGKSAYITSMLQNEGQRNSFLKELLQAVQEDSEEKPLDAKETIDTAINAYIQVANAYKQTNH